MATRARKGNLNRKLSTASPGLEPTYPINENVKQTKKRQKKDDEKKVKDDHLDDGLELNESIDSIINKSNTQPTKLSKKKSLKKAMSDNSADSTKDTTEDVMGNLPALIQVDIKTETGSDISEMPEMKPRWPRVNKIDLQDLNKKENVQNKLNSNIPTSISPRSKRESKVRQNRERRATTYTTPPDLPSRMLRNGKYRSEEIIDTNFNVCKTDTAPPQPKIEKEFVDSAKVPEKSIILDIMKQTFNVPATIEPEKPYGKVEEVIPVLPEPGAEESCIKIEEEVVEPKTMEPINISSDISFEAAALEDDKLELLLLERMEVYIPEEIPVKDNSEFEEKIVVEPEETEQKDDTVKLEVPDMADDNTRLDMLIF